MHGIVLARQFYWRGDRIFLVYTDEVGVQLPPLHPRCRCAIKYREVGETTPNINQNSKSAKTFKDNISAEEYFGVDRTNKRKPFGKWISQLTSLEEYAVKRYTSNFYSYMNDWLRGIQGKKDFSESMLKDIKKIILDCEAALNKAELKEPIIIHRQTSYKMLKLFREAPNRIFHDEGFTSSTVVYDSYPGDIDIECVVPAGKGVGMWVAPISRFKDENEFLLNRGTVFKVIEIDESKKPRPFVRLEIIARKPREVIKMRKTENNVLDERHRNKFGWTPAEIKVQDENGNWINGEEFLKQTEQKNKK